MPAADRHLLFGLLALQNGLIDQAQLVLAFQAWIRDKSKSLADHLVARGELGADARAGLDAIVALHVKKHGDVEKSLAAVPAGRSTRENLARLGDPDLAGTLGHVDSGHGSTAQDNIDHTVSYSLGEATSDGQRFRILRPHARGGLGAVFVALDEELHREVALKQILDNHADDPTSRQRFLIEAEITGGLEHPGIVPVYGLGTYAGGRPYYAMRFIKGDSLKEAIKHFHDDLSLENNASRRSLELRKLLRRFTDVCNAIDYAHSRGVLHRDIKPGNVIVGKYGETLVVDWGLAKPLGRSEPGAGDGERTLLPTSTSGSAETLPGSALGTPAYMSPEQAGGNLDRLSPRSDVYSLGATLFCLLTGKPPYEGDDVGEILGRVQRGEAAPPRRLDPSIDKALEAICMKAMSLKPENRYPSCHALAEDIERWMADEPVSAWAEPWGRKMLRWLTRHRTGVTAAAAALLAGVVGLSAVLAVQARANLALADKNNALAAANAKIAARYNLAVDAIKTFHTGVSRDFLLKEDKFKDLRDRLLKSAADFYEKLGALLKDDTDLPSRRALLTANFEVAGLANQVGRKEDALALYQRVLAGREALVRLPGADPATVVDLARSLVAVGRVLSDTGKSEDALAAFERARSALANRDGLPPEDAAARSVFADAVYAAGWLLYTVGRTAEALRAMEHARDLQDALAAADPKNNDCQMALASSHQNLGILLRTTGKPAEAAAEFHKALAIEQKLAEDNPAVTEFGNNEAITHHNLGALLAHVGKPAEAEAEYRKALAIQQKLADNNPAITAFQNNLANSHNSLHLLLSLTGKTAEAEAECRKALAIRQKLADDNPAVTEFRKSLAGSYHNFGSLLLWGMDKPVEAEAVFRKALAIEQKLADDNTAVTEFRHILAISHTNLGALLWNTGKPAQALAEFRDALAIQKKLADDNPAVAEFRSGLADSHNNLGVLLGKTGKEAEAEAEYRKALAIQKKLADDNPTVTRFQSTLANGHNNLGGLLVTAGKSAEGEAECRKALAILRKLAEDHPESLEFAHTLGGTLHNLAEVDLGANRFQEAREKLREAIVWQKKQLAAYPMNHDCREALASHLSYLSKAALGLGREDEAAEADRERAELDASDPRAAALDARLAALLEGARPIDNAERLALAQRAYVTQRYATATRLWAEALADDPKLAADRQAQNRYNAACAAALAGCGKGRNDPAPDDASKARLRRQALDWLNAELAAWSKIVETDPPQTRPVVASTLEHWNDDSDLAGIRDAAALAKLPVEERALCTQLWGDVDRLLTKLRGGK
jgi:serine/threonine-protein kinase